MSARMHIDFDNKHPENSVQQKSINNGSVYLVLNNIADQITKIREIYTKSEENNRHYNSVDIENWLIQAIKIRKLREKYFYRHLFSDPAWDILLDLTIARIRGKRISVSSLCIAASVPTTTGLRKIKDMLSEGLVLQEPDEKDRRRSYIKISDGTYDNMLTYIAEAAKLAGPEFQGQRMSS